MEVSIERRQAACAASEIITSFGISVANELLAEFSVSNVAELHDSDLERFIERCAIRRVLTAYVEPKKEVRAAGYVTTAPDILSDAAQIMRDRAAQYDKPEGERSMGAAVAAFNIVTGNKLRESEGWLLLQLLKDVRDNQTPDAHFDSLVDCVAYAALKAEARIAGK